MGMLESIEKILHDVADLFSANTEAGHNVVYVILIVLIAILCDVLCKLLINRLLLPIIRRTKFEWDDHLYDKKVVSRLAALAPAFILYAFLPSAFDIESSWYILTDRICKVYIIALILRFLNGVLNAFLDIFNEKESLRHKGRCADHTGYLIFNWFYQYNRNNYRSVSCSFVCRIGCICCDSHADF